MEDLTHIEDMLVRRFFAEAAYFAGVRAVESPSAEVHMLAGGSCCGCVEPLAVGQRLLEGAPVTSAESGPGGLRVSPATELPQEGLAHLLQAVRLAPELRAPERLLEIFDGIADDLAYASRREIHRPPEARSRYSHRVTCVAAALLLRELTGTNRPLPGVDASTLQFASHALNEERGR
jgi:hypothetical protein